MLRSLPAALKDCLPLWVRRHLMDQTYAHFMFSRFEQVRFDSESWRMATPEPVAARLAQRYQGKRILDAYAGIGGNAIAFAAAGNITTAVEHDCRIFEFLRHNAQVYGVARQMELVCEDVRTYLMRTRQRFELLYLDPPWGNRQFDPRTDVSFFSDFATEIIFELPKEMSNERIFSAGASFVCEVCVNATMLFKEAHFVKSNVGNRKVAQEYIQRPELRYHFP